MTSYGPHARVVVAGIDYTEVHDEWMNPDIMKKATPGNTRVVISRGRQRGQLMVGDEVAMDFPVCVGKASHRTPVGHFRITEKAVHHVSNLYDASMPYFMRLTDSGIGMHVGPVFQTPQSHGCIRMTRSSCVPLFKTVKVGTPVTIVQECPENFRALFRKKNSPRFLKTHFFKQKNVIRRYFNKRHVDKRYLPQVALPQQPEPSMPLPTV